MSVSKTKSVKLLGLVAALLTGASLIMSGQHVEGAGIIAAALSSASIVTGS